MFRDGFSLFFSVVIVFHGTAALIKKSLAKFVCSTTNLRIDPVDHLGAYLWPFSILQLDQISLVFDIPNMEKVVLLLQPNV